MPAFIDLTGRKFGRLTVIARSEKNFGSYAGWNCVCECGTAITLTGQSLRNGNTKSCGCLRREATLARTMKHGMCGTRVYEVWASMLGRCKYKGDTNWPKYGGRGIKVCERWQNFDNFLHDMGEPVPGMSLERIDNDADYSPDNCRWATAKEQARNRRSSSFLTWNGRTQTHAAWEEELNLPTGTIANRIRSFGHDAEKLLHVGAFPGRRGRGKKGTELSSP